MAQATEPESKLTQDPSAGLTILHKTARIFDRYFVKPCGKYHIPEILAVGSIVCFTWLAYAIRYDQTNTDALEKFCQELNKDRATTAAYGLVGGMAAVVAAHEWPAWKKEIQAFWQKQLGLSSGKEISYLLHLRQKAQ